MLAYYKVDIIRTIYLKLWVDTPGEFKPIAKHCIYSTVLTNHITTASL